MDDNGIARKKERHENRLEEIHYRSIRAKHMNFSESGLFDKWSRYFEYAAAGAGLSGVVVGVTGVVGPFKLLQGRWGKLMSIALTTSAIMEISARNVSDLFPSLANRAKMHVQAGSEMTGISRKSKFYLAELRATKPEDVNWEYQKDVYFELLKDYKRANEFTVIREKAYQEFTDPQKIAERYKKRKEQLATFKEHTKED